jgi:hypothetical protein
MVIPQTRGSQVTERDMIKDREIAAGNWELVRRIEGRACEMADLPSRIKA